MLRLNEQDIKIYFEVNSLLHCCGVGEVGDFSTSPWNREGPEIQSEDVGTGMFVSTFIDNPACELAYKQLTKEHKLLYQSPLKRNTNSGRDLFLCVFLHKDKV